MSTELSKKKFNKMVDLVLANGGTPRNYLFEYPYNEFESRALIAKAEKVVNEILHMLDVVVTKG